MNRPKLLLPFLLIIAPAAAFLLAPLWGCSKKSPAAPIDARTVDELIDGVSPWPDPPPDNGGRWQQKGPCTRDSSTTSSGLEVCTKTEYDLCKNMHEIVAFDPNADVLWPGALVQSVHLPDGLLEPIPVPRGDSLKVYIAFPGMSHEDISRTIYQPDGAKVAGAINAIVGGFLQSGNQVPARVTWSEKTAHDFEQVMLDLGVSVNWSKGYSQSLEQDFHYSHTRTTNTYMFRFTQAYYTATIVNPASCTEVFAPSVTVGDLRPYVYNGNPPCYVSGVTYGREIILSISSTSTEDSVLSATTYALNNAGLIDSLQVDLDVAYTRILDQSEINMLVLGGNASDGVESAIPGNWGPMFARLLNNSAKLTATSQGVPISYTTKFLKNAQVVRLHCATSFATTQCVWADQPFRIVGEYVVCDRDEGVCVLGICSTDDLEMDGVEINAEITNPGLQGPGGGATQTVRLWGPESFEITQGHSRATSFDKTLWVQKAQGAKVRLTFSGTEKDQGLNDNDHLSTHMEFNYPTFRVDCSSPVCTYESTAQDGDQKLRFRWRVDLNPPAPLARR